MWVPRNSQSGPHGIVDIEVRSSLLLHTATLHRFHKILRDRMAARYDLLRLPCICTGMATVVFITEQQH